MRVESRKDHHMKIAFLLKVFLFNTENNNPGRKFFKIHGYFSNIASNSADTAFNLLSTTDAPLS